MKLTQTDIAALAGVPVATWRNWEQGRVSLDPAVRTLLRVLWREPDAVRRAMVA
ncbi:helix-turn-helix domain-containing protein [Acetobacter thailandicus]|uniref:helix-turn-helix domain-containing protein n=1 Tax=Acetobacter thailandicus TaxID=1502842 RepID=UPI003144F59E